MEDQQVYVDAILQAFGLPTNYSGESCRNYQADHNWMDRSGNLCWGMGASNYVPCINCGVVWMNHWWDELDDLEST